MDVTFILGLIIIGIIALLILWGEHLLVRKRALFLSLVLIVAAMTLRGICMPYQTLDYIDFLSRWVQFFRDNGGFVALSENVGNYNVPYLYFLAAFSYLKVDDLYLIKLLSVFFDVVLAWAVMRVVYIYSKSLSAVLGAFFVTLFLPSVVLNGALWGQCDSIYCAFGIWSVYFALDGKPIRSVIAAAICFSYKLQAVFILPALALFLFTRRIKWWQLMFFPLSYVLMVLPAVLCGRPFLDTLTLYFSQAGSVGSSLNYNSASVFSFIRSTVDNHLFSVLGIAAAAIFLGALLLWVFLRRDCISDKATLACCLLICIAVPFFLPHMHDRYFFIADILSIAFAFVVPKLFFIPVCVSFASLLGYYAYLFMRFALPMRYGAMALLVCMLVLLGYVAYSMRPEARLERKR